MGRYGALKILDKNGHPTELCSVLKQNRIMTYILSQIWLFTTTFNHLDKILLNLKKKISIKSGNNNK